MADAVRQGRVVVQLLAIRRHHFQHLRLPGRGFQRILEGRLFQHLQHDRRGGRSARRSAEQGDHAAVGRTDDFGTELQDAAILAVLHDLHALAGRGQGPVFHLRVRQVVAQGGQAVFRRQHHLLDQVLGERDVVDTGLQHRTHVVGRDRGRHVDPGTVLQVLGREGRERSEQQGLLAVDDAGVQVGHRHRRRADRSLAVHLGQVGVHQ